jgi:predicted DNA-binding protein
MHRPVCVHLPDHLVTRLDAAAEADQRSRSSIVRLIVEKHLAEHERLSAALPMPTLRKDDPQPDVSGAVHDHLRHHTQVSRRAILSGVFDPVAEAG